MNERSYSSQTSFSRSSPQQLTPQNFPQSHARKFGSPAREPINKQTSKHSSFNKTFYRKPKSAREKVRLLFFEVVSGLIVRY